MDKKLKNLIEHKEQLFWSLQILGWVAYCAARTLNAYALGEKSEFIYAVIMGGIGGFWITIGLRHTYHFLRLAKLPPLRFLLSIILCIGISSMLFSFIEVWAVNKLYNPDRTMQEFGFLYRSLYDSFVLMAWTGFYFVINYQFQLQQHKDQLFEQREMYLAATAQAHQAQLKMLRYQLNPHFLFNTLNAISTLILDNRTNEANNMLTKLSAFLRFSLVNEPMQKTTLEEELYALSLYLDIERVRFEERLNVIIDASDEARKALIPSLLLQPIVENSIKYAISQSIEGGTITIKAAVIEGQLDILLSDDGPGLQDVTAKNITQSSSGLGLANIKERLNKLYPKDSSFELINKKPTGVTIHITLPCEFIPPQMTPSITKTGTEEQKEKGVIAQ